MATIEAGQDTDAYCGKCKMVLAHVIIAMKGSRPARVECKTCGAVHAYKKDEPRKGTGTKRGPSKSSIAARVAAHDKLLEGRDISSAVRYKISQEMHDDDVIDHKTFGIGLVTRVLADRKIEVSFQSGTKVLVHNRG